MEGGQTNEQRVFAYLTQSMGLNAAAACGVMANVYAESGFIPTNLQNSFESKLGYTDASYTAAVDDGSYTNFVRDGAGYGLCQWTYYSRKQALLNFARGRGESVGDLTMQLDFMRGEMASSLVRYLNGVENSADGAYQAAAYFCREFEKPSDTENAAKVRGNLAVNTFWPRYAGADLPAYIGRVTASPSLSINDRPAASSEGLSVRLGLIPKGETCIVYPDRSEGIWRWVEYKGIHGYAHGGYIEYVRAAVTGAAAVAELGFDGGDCLAWITDAPDGARALLAGYDAYGRMLALETEELSGGGICRFTVPAGVRRVRVFVVDADCAPLCAAAEARR
ncbi:MAG: hypothetical protein IJU66_06080 [Oscillospiraceae bacterium]|nr:hypothetical protein [Oscillospiraceae bacterium]